MTAETPERSSIAYMFFNEDEARTVESIAERVFPADESGPGARDADVVIYIDRALAGYGKHLHRLYRRGVAALDRYAERQFGRGFVVLAAEQQDAILNQLEAWGLEPVPADADADADASLLAEFFGALRLHTLEGMFCDPMYGGNRDMVGWRLIGFPGAQWGYTAEQMKLGFDATTIPIKSLADLRRDRVEIGLRGVKQS